MMHQVNDLVEYLHEWWQAVSASEQFLRLLTQQDLLPAPPKGCKWFLEPYSRQNFLVEDPMWQFPYWHLDGGFDPGQNPILAYRFVVSLGTTMSSLLAEGDDVAIVSVGKKGSAKVLPVRKAEAKNWEQFTKKTEKGGGKGIGKARSYPFGVEGKGPRPHVCEDDDDPDVSEKIGTAYIPSRVLVSDTFREKWEEFVGDKIMATRSIEDVASKKINNGLQGSTDDVALRKAHKGAWGRKGDRGQDYKPAKEHTFLNQFAEHARAVLFARGSIWDEEGKKFEGAPFALLHRSPLLFDSEESFGKVFRSILILNLGLTQDH